MSGQACFLTAQACRIGYTPGKLSQLIKFLQFDNLLVIWQWKEVMSNTSDVMSDVFDQITTN